MSTIRIALATPPFPRSISHGVELVEQYASEAAGQKSRIICFPESFLPGYRGAEAGEAVAPHDARALEGALEKVRSLARRHQLAVILPMDWDHPSGQGILNLAMVISDQGQVLGGQTKNQLDPSEDALWTAGDGSRQLFETAGVKFGVAICHEGFRYPETVRWAARRGAQIVFHPHCTGNNHRGRRLTQWGDRANPYYERAMMCRALENTIFFASVNYAFTYQDAATTVVGPQGELVAHQPYGEAGVLVTELDLTQATGHLALRCRAEDYR